MRRLILLRHAKTESHAPSGEDIDRRLDARGEDDAAAIGRWMAEQRCRLGHVLVSPAVRARQTWDIVAPLLGDATVEVTYLRELYLAEPADILRAIREAGGIDARCLMVVGHNPMIEEFLHRLVGKEIAETATPFGYPTAGLAVLDFDKRPTEEDYAGACLAGFMTPRPAR